MHSPKRTRAMRRRGDGGYSLLEVLIAVFLVGTVVMAIAAGMLTILRATRAASDNQTVSVALLSFTESIKAGTYLPCGATPAPSAVNYTTAHGNEPDHWRPPAGMTAAITKVELWKDAATPSGYGEFVATPTSCPASGDQGRQRLTVSVTLEGRPSRSAYVVIGQRPTSESGQ